MQASTRKNSRSSVSEGEEDKEIRLLPELEIENSALHNIRDAANHWKTAPSSVDDISPWQRRLLNLGAKQLHGESFSSTLNTKPAAVF